MLLSTHVAAAQPIVLARSAIVYINTYMLFMYIIHIYMTIYFMYSCIHVDHHPRSSS